MDKPRRFIVSRLLVSALAVASLGAEGAWAQGEAPWTLCAQAIGRAEPAQGLPAHLLQAISKVESGRWSDRESAVFAWPWTVMAEGRGRYLPSKAAAIAEVEGLRARGVSNIDVGCMQINLRHHPDAFESLDEAFEPARNVAYAAALLLRLRADTRSWTRAIGRYHSATPVYGNRYRRKVQTAWREERHAANRRRRDDRATARAPIVSSNLLNWHRAGGRIVTTRR